MLLISLLIYLNVYQQDVQRLQRSINFFLFFFLIQTQNFSLSGLVSIPSCHSWCLFRYALWEFPGTGMFIVKSSDTLIDGNWLHKSQFWGFTTTVLKTLAVVMFPWYQYNYKMSHEKKPNEYIYMSLTCISQRARRKSSFLSFLFFLTLYNRSSLMTCTAIRDSCPKQKIIWVSATITTNRPNAGKHILNGEAGKAFSSFCKRTAHISRNRCVFRKGFRGWFHTGEHEHRCSDVHIREKWSTLIRFKSLHCIIISYNLHWPNWKLDQDWSKIKLICKYF